MDDAQKIEYVMEYITMQRGVTSELMNDAKEADKFFYYNGKLHAYNEILKVLNEEN